MSLWSRWFGPTEREMLAGALEALHSEALAVTRAAEAQARASEEMAKALQAHLGLFSAPHAKPTVAKLSETRDQANYLKALGDEHDLAKLLREEMEGWSAE